MFLQNFKPERRLHARQPRVSRRSRPRDSRRPGGPTPAGDAQLWPQAVSQPQTHTQKSRARNLVTRRRPSCDDDSFAINDARCACFELGIKLTPELMLMSEVSFSLASFDSRFSRWQHLKYLSFKLMFCNFLAFLFPSLTSSYMYVPADIPSATYFLILCHGAVHN